MESAGAPAPPWGPGFLRLNGWVYRAEYAAATGALAVVVIGWQFLILHALSWQGLGLTLVWFVWPDLAAFLPIGLGSGGSKGWPPWGPTLYNTVHNFLVWGAVFGAWSLVTGAVAWPLLGWAAHITMDRAAGFYLRAPGSSHAAASDLGSGAG